MDSEVQLGSGASDALGLGALRADAPAEGAAANGRAGSSASLKRILSKTILEPLADAPHGRRPLEGRGPKQDAKFSAILCAAARARAHRPRRVALLTVSARPFRARRRPAGHGQVDGLRGGRALARLAAAHHRHGRPARGRARAGGGPDDVRARCCRRCRRRTRPLA